MLTLMCSFALLPDHLDHRPPRLGQRRVIRLPERSGAGGCNRVISSGTFSSLLEIKSFALFKIEFARTAVYCKYGPESPSNEIDFSKSKIISLPIDDFKIEYFKAATPTISETFFFLLQKNLDL